MITGGVASVIYGDPRFTRDVDIVVELRPATVLRLAEAFSGGEYYVPSLEALEALEAEAIRVPAGHFNIIHRETALRADVCVAGADPFHAWALERRRRLQFEAIHIWVAPLEYVVVRKLEYYRKSASDRHVRDVAMMLRISGDQLQTEDLDRWLSEFDLHAVFRQAQGYDAD